MARFVLLRVGGWLRPAQRRAVEVCTTATGLTAGMDGYMMIIMQYGAEG
jgi:hypothetical protein